MLTNLAIKNYALIDDLNVSFTDGFTVITGETGAGKSILLGGLSLVLGKRADLGSLRDKDTKCVIEAEFQIDKYGLNSFFDKNDLEYAASTIIRREIHPSGKSRAFINDSPVTLDILTDLGGRLIDVHSQHQTLKLTENEFQLKVIDALANNSKDLLDYQKQLATYKETSKALQELIDFQKEADKEHDYNTFLLQELEQASLQEGMQEDLEAQYEQLNNVETILEQLSKGYQLLNDEQVGVLTLLAELKQASNKLSDYGNQYAQLNERIQSVFIEIDDISNELESFRDTTEANPAQLEEVNAKLQLLYDLQRKHDAQDVDELLAVKKRISEKVSATENLAADIQEKGELLLSQKEVLEKLASSIHMKRQKAIPELQRQLLENLSNLGMSSASFNIELHPSESFKDSGKDDLTFLFSANKGTNFGELKKIASGGELSRIMLTIKSILARYEQLPTMMFDEIDTGVSGEISHKMGDIMQAMSSGMQVFSITHLPQVASKGHQHFKVFKEEDGNTTHTRMRRLSQDERVVELAEMLGGKSLSDAALAHAKQLLN
ncbi:DNA repair protein RecN [Flavobacteriaceae bacterium TP-CH-4]|uniref:DNA repair protein RecN n=1 Tax=Pelagihabitans pacificus TaxID=2696054 RepID=A0A967AST0_9FLAO|nr:DNA repair protein RecN [Pelagihabitans pacificus]NHF59302.1 DNA repair protein RecN [Pelagihabitans pacificus]